MKVHVYNRVIRNKKKKGLMKKLLLQAFLVKGTI